MNEFVGQHEYSIAWAVYLVSGIVFSGIWFRLTRFLKHSGWRDLLRGIALIAIFTPWFTSTTHEHLAPAVIVILMDVLLGSTPNALSGAIALLMSLAAMLIVLIVRRIIARRGAMKEHHNDK